jgi:hypothetical protein
MKPWKAALGVGAACVACCAVPLLGGAAALTVSTATLAAAGSALLACADGLVPLAGGLLALAAGAGGFVWWQHRARRQVQSAPGCRGGCNAGRN